MSTKTGANKQDIVAIRKHQAEGLTSDEISAKLRINLKTVKGFMVPEAEAEAEAGAEAEAKAAKSKAETEKTPTK